MKTHKDGSQKWRLKLENTNAELHTSWVRKIDSALIENPEPVSIARARRLAAKKWVRKMWKESRYKKDYMKFLDIDDAEGIKCYQLLCRLDSSQVWSNEQVDYVLNLRDEIENNWLHKHMNNLPMTEEEIKIRESVMAKIYD